MTQDVTWNPPSCNITPSGYTCSCGAWVQYGQYHQCVYWSWPVWSGIYPTQPSVTRFRGSVGDLDELPLDAIVGDGVYVRSLDVLVVRVTGGWHHFDRA